MAVRTDKAEIITKAMALINNQGKTAKQAAKILGVPQSTLNEWLQGVRPKVKRGRQPKVINREFNDGMTGESKPPRMVTIGTCIACGKPIVVAAFIAERATWKIEHCSRECRNGAAEEMEEAI